MKFEPQPAEEGTWIEEGTYPATFLKVEPEQSEDGSWFLRWRFEVKHEDQGIEISGLSSKNFTVHPNCKAWRWAQALDPELDEEAEEWDSQDVQGTACQVKVKHRKSNGSKFPNVVDVYPLPEGEVPF